MIKPAVMFPKNMAGRAYFIRIFKIEASAEPV